MTEKKTPSFMLALLPILVLVSLLALNVKIYGEDATYGPNQIGLLIAAAVAAVIGIVLKYKWDEMQKGVVKSIKTAIPALLILLLIGSLAGTWMISGVVPTMIYYGLQVLSPTVFLFASCVVSGIVALATGSSWSTVATVGIALLGIGTVLGVDQGMTAGAIISGAYFGDKMSPLSDTTNLAPAMAGTDLFTHIRYMSLTTIPSISIALIIFLVMGFMVGNDSAAGDVTPILDLLESKFFISPVLFIVPLVVIFLIIRKVSAVPALFIGTILGAIAAIVFQPDIIKQVSTDSEDYLYASYKASIDAMFGEVSLLSESNALYQQILEKDPNTYGEIHKLFGTRGMAGMMNTIWLIVCAMTFGGIMEACGLLQKITKGVLTFAKNTGSLIATTASTCVFFNATASDQYLAIVVPGRMFRETFKERGLAPENLSRTLEDSGTVTSVLFPWNTCGAAQSSVLQVATGEYALYCFFNWISPIMTMIYGYFGIKIAMRDNAK